MRALPVYLNCCDWIFVSVIMSQSSPSSASRRLTDLGQFCGAGRSWLRRGRKYFLLFALTSQARLMLLCMNCIPSFPTINSGDDGLYPL